MTSKTDLYAAFGAPRPPARRRPPGHPGFFVGFVVLFLSGVPLGFIKGAVLAKLWEWFAVDEYGLPGVSVVQAAGLLTGAYLILSGIVPTSKESDKTYGELLFSGIFTSLMFSAVYFLFGLFWVQFL